MTEEVMVDELETLKARAKQLGIKHHPSIGVDALRDKVNAALASETDTSEEELVENTAAAPTKTKAQILKAKKAEANKLIRVRITCMNPAKKDWEGEIFTGGNSVVGTTRKMVPFETEWHVPQVLLNVIENRKYQSFYKVKTPKGEITKNKLVKEFSVDRLQPLTKGELKDLAQRQAMANGTAEA